MQLSPSSHGVSKQDIKIIAKRIKPSDEARAQAKESMQSARPSVIRRLRKFGWTSADGVAWSRADGSSDTCLRLSDMHMFVGRTFNKSSTQMFEMFGMFPLNAVKINDTGVWLDPICERSSDTGLLGWLRPRIGIFVMAKCSKPNSKYRLGEYVGIKIVGSESYVLVVAEGTDGVPTRYKIDLLPGAVVRVCLVSATGKVLLPVAKVS